MTAGQFKIVKLIVVALLVALFSISITRGDFIQPAMGLAASILALLILRKRVTEVMADERDYEAGGTAARWTIQAYGLLATVIMFFLYANRGRNPTFEAAAYALAYSTCALLLIYSLIFKYRQKFALTGKKKIYVIFAVIVALLFLVASARLWSGEDDWVCKDGQWVRHGQPDFPPPSSQCPR